MGQGVQGVMASFERKRMSAAAGSGGGLWLAAVAALTAVPAGAGTLESTGCWFDTAAERPAECAWYWPGGRVRGERLRMPVVRLPGEGGDELPPVLYVPGGPGYPAGLDEAGIRRWRAWREQAGWDNDLLLFDPRGTGLAQPAIDCPEIRESDRTALDWALTGQEAGSRLRQAARTCLQRLGGPTTLSHFGPQAIVGDIGGLIAELPEPAVTLWGVSYGSRLALNAARASPERVAALLLDSVYPPGENGLLAQPAQIARGLQVIERACADEPDCAEDHADVAGAIDRLLVRVDAEPEIVAFRAEPEAPETELMVTARRLLWMLLFAAYQPAEAEHAARAVALAAAGDSSALAPLARGFTATLLDAELSLAVHYTAVCAEDGAIAPDTWRATLARHPRVGPYLPEREPGLICDFWETEAVPAAHRETAPLAQPALLIQGGADPVTPPAWSRTVAERLPNAQRLVVPGAGHAPSLDDDCAMRAAAAFLAAPSGSPPPACPAAAPAE